MISKKTAFPLQGKAVSISYSRYYSLVATANFSGKGST